MSRTFITDLVITLAHPVEAVNKFLWKCVHGMERLEQKRGVGAGLRSPETPGTRVSFLQITKEVSDERPKDTRILTEARGAHSLHLLLGREFVKLIKIILHGLICRLKSIGRLKILPRYDGQFPFDICHYPLVWPVKLIFGYMLILVPQAVEAGLLAAPDKVAEALNRRPNIRLSPAVKLTKSSARHVHNLLADEQTEPIFFHLHPSLATVIDQKSPSKQGGTDGDIEDWTQAGIIFLTIVILSVPMYEMLGVISVVENGEPII